MKYVNKMRKQIAGMLVLLAMALMFAAPVTVLAETEPQATEDTIKKENGEAITEESEILTTGTAAGEAETGTGVTETGEQKKEPPFTFKEGFVFFVCCLFSVVICIVFALWGNPNDRLKARYKRARKMQELQEKKLRAQEERQRRFAEEDALYEKAYAEAVAEAEAKAKEKEEAKAKKEAEKAQRAAERVARKANR